MLLSALLYRFRTQYRPINLSTIILLTGLLFAPGATSRSLGIANLFAKSLCSMPQAWWISSARCKMQSSEKYDCAQARKSTEEAVMIVKACPFGYAATAKEITVAHLCEKNIYPRPLFL